MVSAAAALAASLVSSGTLSSIMSTDRLRTYTSFRNEVADRCEPIDTVRAADAVLDLAGLSRSAGSGWGREFEPSPSIDAHAVDCLKCVRGLVPPKLSNLQIRRAEIDAKDLHHLDTGVLQPCVVLFGMFGSFNEIDD